MKSLFGVFSVLMGMGQAPARAASEPQDVLIVDVRTADEFRQEHVHGALHIDILQPDFQSKVAQLDKLKAIKVYCRSGNRSGQALRILKGLGFQHVENIGSLGQAKRWLVNRGFSNR